MFATKDYTNKAEGGLSFKRGSSVYVLLRNEGGWSTGVYVRFLSNIYYKNLIGITLRNITFVVTKQNSSGMANGVYGTFQESAVSDTRTTSKLFTLEYSLLRVRILVIR